MIYYTRSAIYHSCRIYEILHQCHIILCLLIVWDIIPNPQYLMAAYFMIYYSKTTISHGCWFHEIYSRTTISHGCLFCDILYQNHNISWLQISWDITQLSHYLIVEDFLIFYMRSSMFHGCRFDKILHQDHNI